MENNSSLIANVVIESLKVVIKDGLPLSEKSFSRLKMLKSMLEDFEAGKKAFLEGKVPADCPDWQYNIYWMRGFEEEKGFKSVSNRIQKDLKVK